MSHNNHTESRDNAFMRGSAQETIDYYLNLAEGWTDPYGPPIERMYEGVRTVCDHEIVGTKCRGGDLLAQKAESDTLVYIQPRTGLAGVSLAEVCRRHNKKLVLFMPSSKRISEHQAAPIERGAEARFIRIASTRNLQQYARKWSEERGFTFIPLGLKSEYVVAGLVKTMLSMKAPDEFWTAVSTSVLNRSLQIAFPEAKAHGVAVARNLAAGERGRAEIISAPEPFTTPARNTSAPFDIIPTYDLKAWREVPKHTDRDVLFWNVGGTVKVHDEAIYDEVDSQREWGNMSDLEDHNATRLSHSRILSTVG